MSEAPERIALPWELGKAVTKGPLMAHPDYTNYVRLDLYEELEAKLAKAEADAENAKECLKSWFNTKKLAQDQVDPEIVKAASGYLRVSRSGGMEPHESDLVLDVIQDMAFRGVFSSIYTQFTLAELKGDKE